MEDTEDKEVLSEVLSELKILNKNLAEEQKVREEKDTELEKTNSENKEISEERFNKISAYLESQQKKEDDFQTQLLGNLNQVAVKDESFDKLSTQLDTLIQTVGVDENQAKYEEVHYNTDLIIVFFLMGVLPIYLIYRGLTRFFDIVTT